MARTATAKTTTAAQTVCSTPPKVKDRPVLGQVFSGGAGKQHHFVTIILITSRTVIPTTTKSSADCILYNVVARGGLPCRSLQLTTSFCTPTAID